MNRFALAAAVFAASAAPSAASVLSIEVFDNGTLIDSVSSVSGAATLTASDATFSNITVAAQGSPILPRADLSSVTLDATAASTFTGSHTLAVDILQTGVTGGGGTRSTMTVNGLVNDPGPTTETTLAGGVLQATHTFPVGLLDGSAGPFPGIAPVFTSDEITYSVDFTARDQSFGGSAQLTTNVPEPATWVMFLIGAAFMGWGATRRVSRPTVDSLT